MTRSKPVLILDIDIEIEGEREREREILFSINAFYL